MSTPARIAMAVVLLAGDSALAEVPAVVADIAPVHSLVARVMGGVGAPDLLLSPGASPHEYNLRPSEAGALQGADLIFWVGEDLTPWFGDAAATLGEGAKSVALSETEGTTLLPFREGALFDDHDETNEHDHDHEEGRHDPHSWLSPENASVWLDAIAAELSAADPENGDTYAKNAEAGKEDLAILENDVRNMLDPLAGRSFVVFHDAYQYFEASFGLQASGAISLGDASDPSPSRLGEIRNRIVSEGIDCVLAEPQFNAGLVETVTEGTTARTAVLDPLGASIDIGPQFYPQLLENLASALSGCLS